MWKVCWEQKVLRAAWREWEGVMESPEDRTFAPSPPFLPAVTLLCYSHCLHRQSVWAKERHSDDPTPLKPCSHPPQAGLNVLGSLPLLQLFLVPPVEHPKGWQCLGPEPLPTVLLLEEALRTADCCSSYPCG